MHQFSAFEFVASLFEQFKGTAQTGAVAARAVADRRRPLAGQNIGSYRARIRLEQFEFARVRRHAMRRQIAGIEIAGGTFVEIEEVGAVDPLEVEQVEDRLAHADIGEYRAARVEDEAVHALRQAVVELFFDHAAITQRRKIVTGLPARRIRFQTDVVISLFESLEVGIPVPVIVEFDLFEIP